MKPSLIPTLISDPPRAIPCCSFSVALLLLSLFGAASCRGVSAADLPRLIEALEDQESRVRNQAALDLAALGREARPATRALIKRLQREKNRGVRTSVAYALRQIDTAEARAALEQYRATHPPGQ